MTRRPPSRAASPRVVAVSVVPGRVRWAIGDAHAPGASWSAACAQLAASPGIHEVRWNPVTLRVLVLFDTSIDAGDVERRLLGALDDALDLALDALDAVPPGARGARVDGSPAAWSVVSRTADAAGDPSRARGPARTVATAALVGGAVLTGLAAAGGIVWAAATAGALVVGFHLARRAARAPHLQTDRANLAALLRECAPLRPLIGRGTAFAIVDACAGVARLAAFGLGIDLVLRGGTIALLGISLAGAPALALVAVAVAGLTGIQLWARFQSYAALFTAGRELQHRMRVKIFDHVQRLPMEQFVRHTPGQLAYVIVDDVSQIERTVDAGARLLMGSLTGAIQLAAIFAVSPPLGLVSLAIVGTLAAVTSALQPRLRTRFSAARAVGGRLNGQVTAVLQGVATVRAFEAEGAERARVARTSRELHAAILQELPALIGTPLAQEAVVMFGLLAASLASAKTLTTSAGRYFAGLAVASNFLSTLSDLSSNFTEMSRGLTSFGRVRALLELAPETSVPAAAAAMNTSGPLRGSVAYDRVSFSYPGGPPVLHDVSVSLPEGKTVAVVGLSGSGKSTLVNLLLGFYPPDRGTIRIDGADIANVPRGTLRRAIAVVSQDVQLFPFSVHDNIALGRPGTDRASVIRAARLAYAHDFIEALPDGYDTILSDRGTTLSGGQRQRLAIARAILKDAPLLVLDEATSHLDATTDDLVQGSLRTLAHGRTVLVIAHKLSTIEHADQCYVFEHGRVIGQGVPSQLRDG
ncbi:ABC transporter ATP-binding protein [Pendulispora albinea]|uniref:ABC transporter ATP-binding protein/permease n=1 Tax=Pendulispora albinea TaxID=2741071 RepID=A0ABZ2LLE0_9BACT